LDPCYSIWSYQKEREIEALLPPHIIGNSLSDKFKDVLIQDSTIMLHPHIIGTFLNITLEEFLAV
jgi:hypothetical protein